MGAKNTVLACRVTFFVLCIIFSNISIAQQGSVYISAGYNMTWFGSSTIHIEQSDLGNSYNMTKVKGDSKTNTPISALNLNYRLGFFYNDVQTHGIELSFDPVNYEITPGSNVHIRGIINNMFDISKTVTFSKANGAYYEMTGANLIMLNMVKRLRIYMANTKKIAVDAIGKVGAGAALPHCASSLPVNPVDDPGFNFAGYTAGAELGLRVRGYRYIYVDLTGKYNYSWFNSLNVYDGTARQNLPSYQVIASVGFTFPTHRLNPLFFREPTIVTILPFYQNKDEVSKAIPKKKVKYDVEGNVDSTELRSLDSIPEFQEILDRKYRRDHPDTIKNIDTTKATWYVDSLGRPIGKDSINAGLVTPKDTSGKETEQHLSKRQLKKKRKAEARAKRELELQQKAQEQNPQDTTSKAPLPAGQEPPAPDTKAPDVKTPDVTPPDQKATEVKTPDQKEPEAKPEEKKEPELSKKELKRKAKEERKARKKKEKEDKKAEDNAKPDGNSGDKANDNKGSDDKSGSDTKGNTDNKDSGEKKDNGN